MTKSVYISFLDEKRLSGYRKKIHGQCEALNTGDNLCYLITVSGNDVVQYNFKTGEKTTLFSYQNRIFDKKNIIDEFRLFSKFTRICFDRIKKIAPDLIYIRRIIPITFALLNLLSNLRKSFTNTKIIYEYPTYPWEKELLSEKKYLFYIIDRLLFKHLENRVDKIVVVGSSLTLGSKYLNINNAISLEQFNFQESPKKVNSQLNLISVANFNIFHGIDRLLEGLSLYVSNNPNITVNIHLVGPIADSLGIQGIIEKHRLEKYVNIHGYLEGEKLEEVFATSDLAVGCLGVHRKGVLSLNSLKNREYCARGLPFIFSEKDDAIEKHEPTFIFKVPFDDSPIDIKSVVDFYEKLNLNQEQIRNFASEHLSWGNEMRKVLETVGY
ncbi:hypothetical protein [Thalassotalea crassostreae]|uniref:hypothetical protein n=1 Tax=Thalassotalea crassostreae TaxID=1763536 RepID=UPI0008390787|nr:hypothetical protein [Thalassotalea crassostreae]